MSNVPIAFIGGGNMARSLISGLIGAGYDADRIRVSDPMEIQRTLLSELGVRTSASNTDAIRDAGVVVLAVKPQLLGDVLDARPGITADQLLVSIAAGVPVAAMVRRTHAEQPVVRCMPNTPALLGAGVTALYANESVNDSQRQLAEQILSTAGRTLWVKDEARLDAVTAVSGSGPAYFFYLMETMIEAGVQQGLDEETATVLTLETAYGAAMMARERSQTPDELRANVTSPGGTTAAALNILEEAGSRDIIKRALAGAQARSRELAKEFG